MPTFFILLFTPISYWVNTKKIIIRDIIFFGCCALIFLFIGKYFQHDNKSIASINQINLNVRNLVKLKQLWNHFSELWNIHLEIVQLWTIYSIVVCGILGALVGFIKYIVNSDKKNYFAYLIQAIIAFACLFLVGNCVFLASSLEVGALVRLIYTFQVMSLIFIFWALYQLIKFFFVNKLQIEKYVSVAAGMFFFIGATYVFHLSFQIEF
jgi:hypothetical protein